MTDPNRLASDLIALQSGQTETKTPVTATIVTHDGSQVVFTIPSFDTGIARFGPFPYVAPESPNADGSMVAYAPGTTILVVQDENDDYWVISP